MNERAEPYSRAKHLAWLATLSPDEQYAAWAPSGHQWNMIAASLAKRWLLEKLDAGLRLRLLEGLNRMTDLYLRPEMLAMIEPMCDTGYRIWKEAKTLDREGDKACMASFRVLTSPRVYDHLTTLNPSILAAIRWRAAYHGDEAHLTPYSGANASEQTPAPERTPAPQQTSPALDPYGHNIPGDFVRRDEIPARFFAIGTPGHPDGDINPHTGR